MMEKIREQIQKINENEFYDEDTKKSKIEEAHSRKVKSEGEADVLAVEIKTDQGRGVSTERKEEQLGRVEESVDKAYEAMGEMAKAVNTAAKEASEGAKADEKPAGAEEEAEEVSASTEAVQNRREKADEFDGQSAVL